MSERDVKDASAGVLKDLKRFQLEKEEDLRRYMVGITFAHLPCEVADGRSGRLHTPNATSTGRRRTWTRGERLGRK